MFLAETSDSDSSSTLNNRSVSEYSSNSTSSNSDDQLRPGFLAYHLNDSVTSSSSQSGSERFHASQLRRIGLSYSQLHSSVVMDMTGNIYHGYRGELKLSVYMNYGLLTVHILQARRFRSDTGGACNAYVKISLWSYETTKNCCRTRDVSYSNDPVFDEKFSLELSGDDFTKRLLISVWNRGSDTNQGSKLLGSMSFGMQRIQRQPVDGWFYLLVGDIGKLKHRQVLLRGTRTRRMKKKRKIHKHRSTTTSQRLLVRLEDCKGSSRGFSVSGACPTSVVSIRTGSAADVAGLRVGDQILSIDGIDVNQSSSDSVARIIRNSSGREIHLEIVRLHPSSIENRQVGLRRESHAAVRGQNLNKTQQESTSPRSSQESTRDQRRVSAADSGRSRVPASRHRKHRTVKSDKLRAAGGSQRHRRDGGAIMIDWPGGQVQELPRSPRRHQQQAIVDDDSDTVVQITTASPKAVNLCEEINSQRRKTTESLLFDVSRSNDRRSTNICRRSSSKVTGLDLLGPPVSESKDKSRHNTASVPVASFPRSLSPNSHCRRRLKGLNSVSLSTSVTASSPKPAVSEGIYEPMSNSVVKESDYVDMTLHKSDVLTLETSHNSNSNNNVSCPKEYSDVPVLDWTDQSGSKLTTTADEMKENYYETIGCYQGDDESSHELSSTHQQTEAPLAPDPFGLLQTAGTPSVGCVGFYTARTTSPAADTQLDDVTSPPLHGGVKSKNKPTSSSRVLKPRKTGKRIKEFITGSFNRFL